MAKPQDAWTAEERQLVEWLADMNEDDALPLANKLLLEDKVDAMHVLDLCRAAMDIVGKRFEQGEYFLPELVLAGEMLDTIGAVAKPLIKEAGGRAVQTHGRVLIGTVRGDLHDIGKNLVKLMMEGKGIEVLDLGTDVAPETFIDAAVNQDCTIICLSALLTTTMGVMREVVEEVEKAGLKGKVKVMIGGAPVTDAYCKEIGADAYTPDAASASDKAVRDSSSSLSQTLLLMAVKVIEYPTGSAKTYSTTSCQLAL